MPDTAPKLPETESERVNVKAIADALRDGFSNLYSLDSQIAALTEKHLTPLRAKKSDIMRVLREGYHMPSALVNARYHGYRVERDAEAAGDNATLDNIRLMYEAVPIYGIVDMVDAMGFKEDKRPTASQKNLAKAKAEGRKASAAPKGGTIADCPYAGIGKDSKKLRDAWLGGFQSHQREVAKKLGKPKKGATPVASRSEPIPNEPNLDPPPIAA